MLTDPANFVNLHLRWLLLFGVALSGTGGWYYSAARSAQRWPGGGSTVGLSLGILAAVLIVFEFALWLRKTRWFRSSRWLGNAQLWMKAHIWLGLFVAPLALMHSAFSFGGAFTHVLMWVLLIVIASGIFGLVVQNIVPRWMLEHVTGETIFSQIDLVKQQYAGEAAHLVYLSCGLPSGHSAAVPLVSARIDVPQNPSSAGTIVGAQRTIGPIVAKTPAGISLAETLPDPQVLLQAFEQVVRPYLEGHRPRSQHLASRRRSTEYFAVLRGIAGTEAESVVDGLELLCEKVRNLELQRRLHYILHGWLGIHLPLSITLLLLLGVHIVYALRFG